MGGRKRLTSKGLRGTFWGDGMFYFVNIVVVT